MKVDDDRTGLPEHLLPGREPVTLRPRRLKGLALIAVCVAFAVVGAIVGADGKLVGWLVLAFFGLGAAVIAASLVSGSSYLRLDGDGFEVRALFRAGRFGWSEVANFRPFRTPGGSFVGFDFAPGFEPRAAVISRDLAGVEGGLPDTYGLTPDQLAALLTTWQDWYAEGPAGLGSSSGGS